MKILALDHFTINVKDMEESIRFYEEGLGLKKLECVDMGDHIIQYFELPGTRLELIKYLYETKEVQSAVDDFAKYRHMALLVDDLEGYCERLRKAGAKITTEPDYVEKLDFHNLLAIDPNGVEIEVLTRP